MKEFYSVFSRPRNERRPAGELALDETPSTWAATWNHHRGLAEALRGMTLPATELGIDVVATDHASPPGLPAPDPARRSPSAPGAS